MKIKKILAFLALLMAVFPVSSKEQVCKDEYERGRREIGGYAELLGVMQGVIYAYSFDLKSPEVCLPDGPELRIKAIADLLKNPPARAEAPIAMDYIFTRDEAHRFLKRFFPCGSNSSQPSDR